MKPLVSIIIIKYKCDEYLQKCLFSIGKNPLWEIILIDNDKNNRGFSKACNLGAQKAKGKYLFFLNPDTLILGDCIKKLADFLEKNDGVAVAGPKIFLDEKREKRQLSFCQKPDLITSLFVFSPLKNIISNNYFWNKFIYAKMLEIKNPMIVEEISGAALMVRKDIFEDINGFDENIFFYFEDNDLCDRIRKANGTIYYFPKAEIIHFGGKSTKQVNLTEKYFRESRFYYFKKNFGIFLALLTEGAIRFLELLARTF